MIREVQESVRRLKALSGLQTSVGVWEGLGWSNFLEPQKICPERKAAVFSASELSGSFFTVLL